jgi:hypothetical protein
MSASGRGAARIAMRVSQSVECFGCVRSRIFPPLTSGCRALQMHCVRLRENLHFRPLFALLFSIAAASGTASAEQQLTVGSVVLKLGEPDSAALQELSKNYSVKRFDGGWSIQKLNRTGTEPGISVHTAYGRIEGVFFTWGPGYTPPAEEVATHLIQALPASGSCGVRTAMRPFEGGVVRRLEWQCGDYTVILEAGVWAQGNTTSISIEKH